MHEMNMALGLLDVALDAAGPGQRVTAAHVRVGVLAGLSPTALASAFHVAATGTLADGAALTVETVAVELWCGPCAKNVTAEPRALRCSYCGTPSASVTSGRELQLAWIEVDDAANDERRWAS